MFGEINSIGAPFPVYPPPSTEHAEAVELESVQAESSPIVQTTEERAMTPVSAEQEQAEKLINQLNTVIQQSAATEAVGDSSKLEVLEQLVASSESILELVNSLPEVSGETATKAETSILLGIQGSDTLVKGAGKFSEALSKLEKANELAGEVFGNVDLLIRLGSLFVVGKAILNINNELTQLNAELEKAQSDLAEFEQNGSLSGQPEVTKQKLDDAIATLTKRISDHQEARTTLCKDTSIALIKASISTAKDDVEIATALAASSATVQRLMLVSGILGMATGVTTLGISLAGIVKSCQSLQTANIEKAALSAELASPTLDPAVKNIILLRLKFLEEKLDQDTILSMQNFIAIVSSSLGVTAGTAKVLILAGVGVAAGTAGAAAVVGIGAGAIAAGLLACGAGYAAYKNRDIIE